MVRLETQISSATFSFGLSLDGSAKGNDKSYSDVRKQTGISSFGFWLMSWWFVCCGCLIDAHAPMAMCYEDSTGYRTCTGLAGANVDGYDSPCISFPRTLPTKNAITKDV